MRLTVNGRSTDLELGNVEALVASLTRERRGVAVAVNGTVVPRSAWPTAPLTDGDVVEVLTAAQGG